MTDKPSRIVQLRGGQAEENYFGADELKTDCVQNPQDLSIENLSIKQITRRAVTLPFGVLRIAFKMQSLSDSDLKRIDDFITTISKSSRPKAG